MRKREFIVKIPAHSTRMRMIEVHFWYIIRVLYFRHLKRKTLPPEYQLYIDTIVESICLLNDVKPTLIKYAIDKINAPFYRPTILEMALTTKYLEFPMRGIQRLSNKGSKTLYDKLEEYIRVGSPDLEPKYEQDITSEIEKFNKGFVKLFKDATQISATSQWIYKDYTPEIEIKEETK